MNRPVLWIIGGVVTLGLIVLLAASIATEESVDAGVGYGEVTVDGDPLPVLADNSSDTAIGMTAPTVSGADWEDTPVSITPDGRAKIIVFLAHWCPHCQAEVPVIQQWLDDGSLPTDVDMYSIATSTDRFRPNWPPQDWLEEEGWSVPVIMDDEIGTAAVAFGMRGTPLYVVLDGDSGTVVRVAGQIGVTGLDTLAQIAVENA